MTASVLPFEAIADARTFTDPAALHALLAQIRKSDPLPYIQAEDYAPFWLVSRHQDIMEIERNADNFINAPRQAMLPLSYEMQTRAAAGGVETTAIMRNLVLMDGTEHKAYRNITQSYFTPKGLSAIVGDIEKLAREFIGRMDVNAEKEGADGEIDFADVAMAFPLRVIMTMLGVPQEDEPLMMRLTQQTLSSQDPEFQAKGGARAAMMEMFAYFKTIIDDLRVTPNDTLASLIANARVDGELLPDRDVFGYFNIIATAGHDTTSYALTGGMLAFLQYPEQLANLRMTPNLATWRPADATETAVAWSQALQRRSGPTALVLSRQNTAPVTRQLADVSLISRGGYILHDCAGTPALILLATGAEVELAVQAWQQLQQQGYAVRVVSMPSTDCFDAQEANYRNAVLPTESKVLAIEAAHRDYWHKYVGRDGDIIAMHSFGESAPGPVLMQHFGFSLDNIVSRASALLQA